MRETELDVAPVRPVAAADRVNEPTVPVTLQPANVATPATAVTGLVVQARVPADAANVTDAVEDAVAPAAVWMVTTGWAARTTPLATEVLGCVVKANLAATGEVMTRLPLYALLVPYGFVAVTVIGKVPELDGVPVTAPVLVLNVVPVGKVPTSV